MKKLLILLLSVMLVFADTAYVSADGPSVSASDGSGYPGNTVYTYIDANDFNHIGGLDLNVYYDSDVLTLVSCDETGILASSEHLTDINTNTVGQINTSSIFTNSLSGSGSLIVVGFRIKQDATPGETTVNIAIGDVYDQNLNPVSLNGTSYIIMINERPTVINTMSLSSTTGISAYENDVFSLNLWTNNAYNMAAADFIIAYDSEKLEYQELTLGSAMLEANGALYDINARDGYIEVSYICLNGIDGSINPIMSVEFKSVADENGQTSVSFTSESVYDSALNLINGSSVTSIIALREQGIIDDKLKITTSNELDENRDVIVRFYVPGETNLAAADFIVSFDNTKVTCSKVEKICSCGSITYNIKNENGQVKFSYIDMDGGLTEDTELLALTFVTANNDCVDVPIDFIVKNPINDAFENLDLECVGTSFHMHKYSGEPNYMEDVVCEICGEVIYPKLCPTDYTIHFDANDGTGEMEDQLFLYGVPQALSKNQFTRQGYRFTGWSCNDVIYQDEQEISLNEFVQDHETFTFYANWAANDDTPYTVNHWREDLSGNYPDSLKESQTLYGQTDSTVTPEVRSYEGFRSPEQESLEISADGTAVLDYYYTRNSYVLTLEKGRGISSASGAGTYKYEQQVSLSAVLLEGYENIVYSGDFSTASFAMPAGNVAMSVSASPILYSISYDLDGGVLEEDNPSSYTVESPAIVLNEPSKQGYVFLGWTGTDLDEPTKDVTIPSGSTGDREYTANWRFADILVESVTLNKTELELTILGSETLQATVLPEDATNRNVTWSSSDMT
ncbi:MAG: InlB B-repeat-containing protein, partial [Erysipelotrichaceae bacterium]|nr:InlB B-repeat-containing protein [Erysipelotrichaceae bacterium]